MKDYKGIFFIVILLSLYLFGCSSGEYELREVKVDYEEKQLVYDTIKTTVKTEDSIKVENYEVISKNDNFSFIVQIGAFIDASNFNRFFSTAKQNLGEGVYFQQISSLYKIRIGNYTNKAEALKMVDHVKQLGYYDAFVITVKNKQ